MKLMKLMRVRSMQCALPVLLLLAGGAHSSEESDGSEEEGDATEQQASETRPPAPEDTEAQESDAEPENRAVIDDIIPSEMISEDLAVDFPIDI
ncbi:MAG: hypothetical protein OXF72_05465 [Gammaproteobacteria bacterium]|nr:hypothetical protein [Gammaproteobacteria bacterium]